MADFKVWEGIYPSFAEALPVGPGFAGDIWRDRSAAQMREAIAQLAAAGSVPDPILHRGYLLPTVIASLLAVQDRVRVLDLGGGLGTGYLATLAGLGLQASERLDFDIVEVPTICASGPALYGDALPAPGFQTELPEAPGSYDIIHAGSVLQYVEDWRGLLAALARLRAPVMLLSDVFAGPIPTFATLQNYYGSRIPHWFVNESELLDTMAMAGARLTLRAPYHAKVLGQDGALPMDHFPVSHRLAHTCHLMFARGADG